jgi:GT2 family glycosyltransferase
VSLLRPDLGVVVIARNEGERLVACLESLQGTGARTVYADSASTDGSPERARASGAEVVLLDTSRPLNAARGRNAGLERLLELAPTLTFVFFVDGDCTVAPGFIETALAELVRDPGLGAVCGRRRELHPDRSLFNRVVDCEWDTPVGEAEAFGGDVVVRLEALRQSGGYDERMNQGEDPELAFRLRQAGWRIRRIAHEMTRHDVALHQRSAWRRRHQRGGYAYAHGAAKHWREPGRYNQRAVASILLWGAVLPLIALGGFLPSGGASLLVLPLYARLWWRIRAERLRRGDSREVANEYATLITLGKVDEAVGVLRCAWALFTRRQALTLDYKRQPDKSSRAAA